MIFRAPLPQRGDTVILRDGARPLYNVRVLNVYGGGRCLGAVATGNTTGPLFNVVPFHVSQILAFGEVPCALRVA